MAIGITWDGRTRLRIGRAMAGKASGPDDWRPEDLVLLPQCWWDAFGKLWQEVYQSISCLVLGVVQGWHCYQRKGIKPALCPCAMWRGVSEPELLAEPCDHGQDPG